MLDNGYVYLAATRLTLFRSLSDWAMIIEVFGFSPRTGLPDTHIHTFASTLQNRNGPEDFVNQKAYEMYLANNPNNESRFVHPIEDGDWLDGEVVSKTAADVFVRGERIALPRAEDLTRRGIDPEDENEIRVFELCRYVADIRGPQVLATPQELRLNVGPNLHQVLQLNEWNHPDVVDDACRPSGSETFQQLADILITGDVGAYRPTLPPNTHWRNWPDGGML
jgi:hypothetical protein